jgi:hypothetical protein
MRSSSAGTPGGAMETVRVSLAGRVVGFVRYDPLTDEFDSDPGVPVDVASDIMVTYFRDNVLFGQNGDGFAWAEAVVAKRVRCQTNPSTGLT